MKIQYQINKEMSLLIQKYSGNWNITLFEKYVNGIINNSDWKYVKQNFADLRNLVFSNPEDVDFNKLLEIRDRLNSDQLIVIMVDKPIETAVSILYSEKLRTAGYNCLFCSTMKYAIELLKIDINEMEMENIIMNLNNVIE